MTRGVRTFDVGAAVFAVLLLATPGAAKASEVLPSVGSRVEERERPRPAGVPDDAALEASGAVIGEVRLVRGNVFDPSIPEEDTALFRLANRLHVVSRESTVAVQLLFTPGDRYDARLLRESERILRTRAYLREARIRPVAYRDGVVDIEVRTQDTWTLLPRLWFNRKGGENSGGIGIEERNLLGFGSELGLRLTTTVDRDSTTLLYRDPHVLGSTWRLDTQYADNSDGTLQVFDLERPFRALDTRWSAGVALRDDDRIDSVYDGGVIVDQFRTQERVHTAYGGWSAGLRDGWVTRWTAGMTSDERKAQALDPATTTGPLPDDRKLVYPWLGVALIEDDHREARNLDQIGRTEDLAFGWHARLRLGLATTALGSDRNATVFDAGVSKGLLPDDRQTLLLSGAASGRVEGGTAVETRLGAAARYYWRQPAGRTFFLGLSADRGWSLDANQLFTLGGDNGLRGYPIRYRTGDRRWLVTAEQRWFTDWYPWRLFNVGGALFFDIGRAWGASAGTSPGTTPPTPDGALKDIGLGLRLGDARSAFANVVHVDLAFPLDGDASIRKVQINIEGKRSF